VRPFLVRALCNDETLAQRDTVTLKTRRLCETATMSIWDNHRPRTYAIR
jgi:hypothetical protein